MTQMAIPNIGNYAIALATAVESLGIEAWATTATTPTALKLGIEAAPESVCLPLKAHLGHFIEADNAGVEYAFMVNSQGTCRLRYYRHMIERILKDMGRKIKIFGLGFDGFKPPIIRHFDPGPITFLKPLFHTMQKIKAVDKLEQWAWYARPREITQGDTTKIMNTLLKELSESKSSATTKHFLKSIDARFVEIPINIEKQPLKVGLVGEISLLRDKCLNSNIEYLLGNQGVELRNFFLLGEELKNIARIVLLNQTRRKYLSKLAEFYLQCSVGGHALDSVAHTIKCADEGYDGMVHLFPAGCMPEVSIRPIIQKVSSDKNIPVLALSFDEHTSTVGVATRVEAFVDVLKERRKKGIAPFQKTNTHNSTPKAILEPENVTL